MKFFFLIFLQFIQNNNQRHLQDFFSFTFRLGLVRCIFVSDSNKDKTLIYKEKNLLFQPTYQQQPFYTSVVQAWPAGGHYYDISSVFQVNGLAPQTFKPQPYRTNTRPRKQNRTTSSSQSETSSSQVTTTQNTTTNTNQNNTRQVAQVPPSVSPQGTPKTSAATNSKPPPLLCDSPRGSHISHSGGVGDNHDAHITSSIPLGNQY